MDKLSMIDLLKRMHARDLMALGIKRPDVDPAQHQHQSRTSSPMLFPRKESFLASFANIKVIVHSNEVLVLEPNRPAVMFLFCSQSHTLYIATLLCHYNHVSTFNYPRGR